MDPLALPSDPKLAKEKKKSSMSGLSEEEEEEMSIRIGRAGGHSGKLFFTPHSVLSRSARMLSLGPSSVTDRILLLLQS